MKVNEAIRDQLIEKCLDVRLCRKFLEKAGNAKFKEMQAELVHKKRSRPRCAL